jgi:hypothetical protein
MMLPIENKHMTEFDVEDVSRIAREAAREQSTTLRVAGVVLGAAEATTLKFSSTWKVAERNPVSSRSVCSETPRRPH